MAMAKCLRSAQQSSALLIFRFVDRIGRVKYVTNCMPNRTASCGPLQYPQRDPQLQYLVSVANRRLAAVNSFLIRFLLVERGGVFFLFFLLYYSRPVFYLTAR